MKKIHYILLVILVIVAAIRIVYEYRIHKDEMRIARRFEQHQKEVIKKGAPKLQKAADFSEMDIMFDKNLPDCIPMNVVAEDNINYIIYGMTGDKCSFEKYNSALSVECLLPVKVAEKYAKSGQEESIDSFVNEVNNNPEYCQLVPVEQMVNKKQDKKSRTGKVKTTGKK